MGADIGEIGPQAAWNMLQSDSGICLIDVRTRAEWSFVGVPDLSDLDRNTILVEWKSFPQMGRNENFVPELMAALAEQPVKALLFICRSGARSLEAARVVSTALGAENRDIPCINVAEGFEGDLNATAHRGHKNGWKAAGLPWRQS